MTNKQYFISIFSAISAGFILFSCASAPKPVETPGPQGEISLVELVASGNTAEIKKRFSGTESVNQKNAQGQSLLHIAAVRNDSETVSMLLALGATIDITDQAGDTPMGAAISAGSLDAVKILSSANASLFSENNALASVFTLAMNKGLPSLSAIITPKTVAQQDKNGKTALHYAASALNEEAISVILAAGGAVSTTDNGGNTPLSLAYADPLKNASANIAAALILAGAEPGRGDFSYFETAIIKRNPSIRFEESRTPLHIASEKGHTGYVAYLIARKVPVNVKDSSSATPLHEAVRNGRIDCTTLLLGAGADPDQKESSGNTPLHLVMPLASRSEIFGKLLAAGANPNLKDNYGETPLHIAARLGMSEDIIRTLVAAGADKNERNKKGVTPLSLAIERKQTAQAALFVSLGSDIHAEDIDGNTALTKAYALGLEMVTAVVTQSNVSSRDSQGRTPLHLAVIGKANPDIVNYLISIKADINARDKNGDSPLHIAVRNNDRASGEILLAHGADVFNPNVTGESALRAALTRMGGRQDWVLNSNVIKMSDGTGNTPLHLAAEWQLVQTVAFIVEKGGDLNARNANGETPLFNAVKADSSAVVTALLSETAERKADINARDYLGNTALHSCIRWAAPNAASTLLAIDTQSNGLRLVNARNLAGKTALHEAARTGNLAFIRSLIASGADINAVDETGKTPLTDAIQAAREDSVAILLEKGASPVMQDMYGRNAFHEAVDTGDTNIITMIRNAGGNPMARDSYGNTPLSLSFRKSAEAVMAVIGSNRNIVDSDGNTPLHIAIAEHSSNETLQGLIKAKFPVNNRNRTGSTALLQAVRGGNLENARMLLDANADPFATDTMGESPVSLVLLKNKNFIPLLIESAAARSDTIGDGILHYAARLADAETVKSLLTMPSLDRTMKNIAGETAYDIAIRWQRPDIAKLLQ
jgi:ankyrin repeat protein